MPPLPASISLKPVSSMKRILAVVIVFTAFGWSASHPVMAQPIALAEDHLREGRHDAAREALEAFIAAPDDPARVPYAEFLAIKSHFEEKDFPRFLDRVHQLEQAQPGHPALDDLQMLRVFAYEARQDWLEAQAAAEVLPTRFPDSPYVARAIEHLAFLNGIILLEIEADPAEARRVLEEFIAAWPESHKRPAAEFYLLKTWHNEGRHLEFIERADQFLRHRGEHPSRASIEQLMQASRHDIEFRERYPHFFDGTPYERLPQSYLDDTRNSDPKIRRVVRFCIDKMQIEQSDPERSEQWFGRVRSVESGPDRRCFDQIDALIGYQYQKRGDYVRASELYERVINSGTNPVAAAAARRHLREIEPFLPRHQHDPARIADVRARMQALIDADRVADFLRAAGSVVGSWEESDFTREVQVWTLNELSARLPARRLRSQQYEDMHTRARGPRLGFLGLRTSQQTADRLASVDPPQVQTIGLRGQATLEARRDMEPAALTRRWRDAARQQQPQLLDRERRAILASNLSRPVKDWFDFTTDLLNRTHPPEALYQRLIALVDRYDQGVEYYHYMVEQISHEYNHEDDARFSTLLDRLLEIVPEGSREWFYCRFYQGAVLTRQERLHEALALFLNLWDAPVIMSEEHHRYALFGAAKWIAPLYRELGIREEHVKFMEQAQARLTPQRYHQFAARNAPREE